MARSHARILCRIWSDKEFTQASVEAQRLYLLLLSQRLVNHAGVVPVTLQKWANTSPGTSVDDVLAGLRELAERRFIVFDLETEELLVRSFIRNDGVAKQPNVLKAALRQAKETDSANLRAALADELLKLGLEMASQVARELNPSGRVPEPIENPSETVPLEPLAKGSEESRGKGKGKVGSEGDSSVGGSVVADASHAKRAPRGTRIPEDFSVTPEMVQWAREHCPDVEGRRATDAFIDHWRGKTGRDATKLDWIATWRNWLRRDQERAERSRPRATPNGMHPTDANIAALVGGGSHLRALPGGSS